MTTGQEQMLPIGALLKQGELRVVRHIASGGFGNTYEVEHARLGKRLAVKEFFMRGINQREGTRVTVSVKDNRDTFDQMREKFYKEAQRLARLEEPHIVEVTDFFDENDTAYYVMKLIDGESLAATMKRTGQPFTGAEVRQILPQVLQALKCVHAQGIYHLDLKPGNIMRNANGHCWLIDFGASKQLSAQESRTLSTSTGLCYTPGFAPSEQISGSMKRIGPWTDFYALGATLYNLLTNQAPPEVDDVKYDGEAAFQFPPSVSKEMKHFVRWLMQPDYPERPQTVEEVEEQLSKLTTVPASSIITPPKPIITPTTPSEPASSVETVRHTSEDTVQAEPEEEEADGTETRRSQWYWIAGIAAGIITVAIVIVVVLNSSSKSEDLLSPALPSTSCPDNHHPHAIDLGLPSGTKWACCNVGAVLPTDNGGYYAWGETGMKETYDENNYQYEQTDDTGTDISGTGYDVAHVRWGGSWCMPTQEQWWELINHCSLSWSSADNGAWLTGPNGKSVFLPAAGSRREDTFWEGSSYWSSTLYDDAPYSAWAFSADADGASSCNHQRYYGLTVRPVCNN